MTITTVAIPLDTETARIYSDASAEDKKKLRLLMSLWLREFAVSPTPLKAVMYEISEKPKERGLTPEILESLRNGN